MSEALGLVEERNHPRAPSQPSPASEGRRNCPPLRTQRAGEGWGGGRWTICFM